LILLVAACGAPAADDAATGDESDLTFRVDKVDTTLPDVDAIGYEMTIAVDDTPKAEKLRAEVVGTYVATADLTELALDFHGNTVDAVKVGAASAQFRRDGDKLVIALPSPVAKGKTFKTSVAYHGDVLQADGQDADDLHAFGGFMVRQDNAEHRRIFTTLNWPRNGRRWIPMRDHPSDGAQFAITAKFPSKYAVLANGKRVNRADSGDGTTTWRYEALEPMPPYDFHLSAYDAWKSDDATSASGIPITTYLYDGAHRSQQKVYGDVHDALDWYEAHWGKFRWGTVSYIEEPIFGGGMENASVVSMDETVFDDLADAREIAFHELAHHWSGNLARIRTWNDFWLSEGFTEYEKARFIAEHDHDPKTVWRGYKTRAFAVDKGHPVRPPDPEVDVLTIFDDVPYEKGALVLRQLERVVGTDKMTAFLKGWFDRHAFEAVSTAQLEKEMSADTGVDVSKTFEGFVYGVAHPIVHVAFAQAADGDWDVTITQTQRTGPDQGFVFPLDLDFVDASGKKERIAVDVTNKSTKQHVHLAAAPVSVVADPDEWLLGEVR
jgi:aminopeptidase N